jgi:hypothetical protein
MQDRRRHILQQALVVVAVWEWMALFDLNVVATTPQPLWSIALALLSGPALLGLMLLPLLRRARIEHRRANGLCLACGYSLQGNVSGVCPECGTAHQLPPAPVAAMAVAPLTR